METQYKGILYKSENDLGTLESKIHFILEGKGNLIGFDYTNSIKNLGDNLNLYDLNLGNYILQSDELEKLEKLKGNLIKNGVEILGNFEYKNNFYIILHKPKIKGDIEINNKLNTYKVGDISFEAIRNPGTLFSTINYLFSGKGYLKSFNDSDKVNFGDNIIYNFYGNHFIIEYSDQNKINDNINYFTNNFEKIEDSFNSVEFENNLQIPEYIGYFKYDGKQYIILKGCNHLTDEINPEKGIYKGVIIEPDKYFEVAGEVQNIVSKIEEIL